MLRNPYSKLTKEDHENKQPIELDEVNLQDDDNDGSKDEEPVELKYEEKVFIYLLDESDNIVSFYKGTIEEFSDANPQKLKWL